MANWLEKIDLSDLWGNLDTVPFPELRDAIVDRITESRWYQNGSRPRGIVRKLLLTETVNQFDAVFNELYDAADDDKIWIETSF